MTGRTQITHPVPPDTITVDGAQYVRAYPVADDKCPSCGRTCGVWTAGQVIDAIRTWVAREGRVPSRFNWDHATPEHPEFQVAIRMFGTWGDAIRAAGFEPHGKDATLYWTHELIVAAMRDYYVRTGTVPTVGSWTKAAPEHPAALTVRKRFGTWNAAIDAAGFYSRGSWGNRVREKLPTRQVIGKVDAASVAEVIRREHATRSFANIAHDCGVDETYLEKIERGDKTTIRADYADRILCALDRPHVLTEAAA